MVSKAYGSSPKRKKKRIASTNPRGKNTTIKESPGTIMKQIKFFELIVNIQWNSKKKKKQTLDLDI